MDCGELLAILFRVGFWFILYSVSLVSEPVPVWFESVSDASKFGTFCFSAIISFKYSFKLAGSKMVRCFAKLKLPNFNRIFSTYSLASLDERIKINGIMWVIRFFFHFRQFYSIAFTDNSNSLSPLCPYRTLCPYLRFESNVLQCGELEKMKTRQTKL